MTDICTHCTTPVPIQARVCTGCGSEKYMGFLLSEWKFLLSVSFILSVFAGHYNTSMVWSFPEGNPLKPYIDAFIHSDYRVLWWLGGSSIVVFVVLAVLLVIVEKKAFKKPRFVRKYKQDE